MVDIELEKKAGSFQTAATFEADNFELKIEHAS
jgi:hypothetical protein